MREMTYLESAIARLGGPLMAAKAIGVHRSSVWRWLKKGFVPQRHLRAFVIAARKQNFIVNPEKLAVPARSIY